MKKFIFTLFLIFWFFLPTYAYELSWISKIYDNFIKEIESRLPLSNQISILQRLNYRIELKLKSNTLNVSQTSIMKDLLLLNENKLNDLLSNEAFITKSQIEIENVQKSILINFKNSITVPSYVNSIISNNKKIYYTKENPNWWFLEFVENDTIKRLVFTKYFEITSSTYKSFIDRNWVIWIHNWNFIFVENYEIEDKIPYSQAKKYFKFYIYNDYNYYLNDWVYYWYFYETSNYINDPYWFYNKSLENLWIIPKNTLLITKSWKFSFITKYNVKKLISSQIIQDITHKDRFLSYVYEDKKYFDSMDSDLYFENLKKLTNNLTSWFTKEQWVQKIYSRIINNISYLNDVDINRKEIFSWVETFKNKSWVCEWYVKIMAYMTMFSWVEKVKVIKWSVINASDFPEVLHAWVSIWDYFFDPTFDDPIWNDWNIEFSDYFYFKIPQDLFYTNRYNLWALPENIKSMSESQRQYIVDKNLYNLVSKYKSSNYNILKKYIFLSENNLQASEKITLNKLISIIPVYDAYESNWNYVKNWVNIPIKSMKYYPVTDENMDILLGTINYNFIDKYIFRWHATDWTVDYRLAYDLQ